MNMNVEHNLFGIPVYEGQAAERRFNSIQTEIEKTISQTTFNRPTNWNTSTQSVSDPSFNTDFIKSCPNLKTEIHYHICNFFDKIDSAVNVNNYKILSSWITKTDKGQHAHLHAHGEHDIAGVYYYKTNGNDGSIFFESPVEVLKNSYCFRHLHKRIRFRPEVGKILLFPAWFMHGVSENTTNNERISVSFNITFNRY